MSKIIFTDDGNDVVAHNLAFEDTTNAVTIRARDNDELELEHYIISMFSSISMGCMCVMLATNELSFEAFTIPLCFTATSVVAYVLAD